MSLRVSDGIGSATPGRLTPLCDVTTPPTSTSQRARPRRLSTTRSRTCPSSIRTSKPGWSTEPSTAGAIGRSSPCATSSPAIVIVRAALERDGLGELADAELRPLQVGDQRDRAPDLLLQRADRLGARRGGPRACRARSSGGRRRSGPSARQHRRVRRGRPDRGDDLGAAGTIGMPLSLSATRPGERRPARIDRPVAELALDPQQLVVLRRPVGARGGARLDLAAFRARRRGRRSSRPRSRRSGATSRPCSRSTAPAASPRSSPSASRSGSP